MAKQVSEIEACFCVLQRFGGFETAAQWMDVQWTSRTPPDQAPQRANQTPPSPPKTASESQKLRFSGAVLLCAKQGLCVKKWAKNCKNFFYCWLGCWLSQLFPNLYFTLFCKKQRIWSRKCTPNYYVPMMNLINASRGIFVRFPILVTGNPKYCFPVSACCFAATRI